MTVLTSMIVGLDFSALATSTAAAISSKSFHLLPINVASHMIQNVFEYHQ